jgi:hypothetical protein
VRQPTAPVGGPAIERRDIGTVDGGDTEYTVLAVSQDLPEVKVIADSRWNNGTWVDIRDVRLKRRAGKKSAQ